MKKLLFLIVSLFVFNNLYSQEFYTREDVTVDWKYWDEQSSWDYLINNGKPVTVSCAPSINGDGIYLTYPMEIVATYFRNGKLIVLTFSDEYGIRIRAKNSNSRIEFLPYVDFAHIIYDTVFDRIMIPTGDVDVTPHYAICIDFNSSSAVRRTSIPDEEETRYYDLSGKSVNPSDHKGRIVIKSSGNKTEKFFNK